MKKLLSKFSWLRTTFWPIYGKENWKFISLLLMMCSSLFCYTILRILKDTYILSAPLAKANSISFVKAYLVMPISLLYMLFFYYLTNKLSKERAFFVSVLPLIAFFSVFYLILLPNVEFFHMSVDNVRYYQETYPSFKNFIPIIGYWSFSLFYVFAELVGTVVITFLFWSFANYCVTREESKRFYPLFATYSHFTFIFASSLHIRTFNPASQYVTYLLIIGSLLTFLGLYYFINHYVLVGEESVDFAKNFKVRPKHSVSFSESLKTILGSKYLMSIVLIIVCYGVSTNLMEVTWKEVFRNELKGDRLAINQYLSNFYIITGIATFVLGFLNKFLLTSFGWGVPSALVPLILMVSSFVFFALIVFAPYVPSWMLFGYTSSYLAMQVGFYQDNIAKGSRYGVMDPNTQMVYMPLNDELKLKGKASVDILGSRLGKSIGSFLESSLSVFNKGADQIALAPIFMPIVVMSCGVWFFAVLYLSTAYSQLLIETAKSENKDTQ